MRVLSACLLFLSVWAASPGAGHPPAPLDDASSAALIDRFLARDDELVTSYSGTRCLEATTERFKATGSMQVAVHLSPERGFEWAVLREDGSGYIRNKVLRKTLEIERDMIARGEPGRALISLENYEIGVDPGGDAANQGIGTMRLRITPRRRDTLLVHGSVLVSDPEGDLLEVQGQMAKAPSWWTTKVQVVRTYGRVSGVRVPVAVSSTAQVRLAGRSQFRMTNAFEQVNGRATGTTSTCTSSTRT